MEVEAGEFELEFRHKKSKNVMQDTKMKHVGALLKQRLDKEINKTPDSPSKLTKEDSVRQETAA